MVAAALAHVKVLHQLCAAFWEEIGNKFAAALQPPIKRGSPNIKIQGKKFLYPSYWSSSPPKIQESMSSEVRKGGQTA
eukprot:scaffold5889_cov115-Cylindrotheca_fusiformis.AAC.4